MDNKSISHICWKCQYHIVFIPKYRKKVLYGKIRDDVRQIISTLCKYKDVKIIAGAVCIDHVHLSFAIPPKLSISNFMGYLKRKSMLMIKFFNTRGCHEKKNICKFILVYAFNCLDICDYCHNNLV